MNPSEHAMFERRLHALVAGLSAVTAGAVLTILVALDRRHSVVQGADDRWLSWMVAMRAPWLTRVAEAMSFLGGPLVMVPLRLVVIGALGWRRRWLQLTAFIGATVTSELCIGPLKALIDRPRPPGALIETTSASFPSGHAIAASVTAIGLVVVLVPAATRRGHWMIIGAAFAAVMAMSRTYLGAHWASDVVAGACIGSGLAVTWAAALELERSRRRRRNAPPFGGGSRPRRLHGVLRVASGGLFAAGVACVVALHALRSDLEPSAHRLSEYALGRYGWVMGAGFICIGSGLLMLAWAILQSRSRGRWRMAMPSLVAIAGAGMILSGFYDTDPGRSGEAADAVHSVASGGASLALIASALMWSVIPARSWRSCRPDAAAALAIAATVLGALSPMLHRSALTGVSQRLLWLTLVMWAMLVARRLVATPAPCGDAVRDIADTARITASAGRQG
jgi:membrane-associated phospholipid phosphatase